MRVEDVARAVAEAAMAVPGVAALTPGTGVEVSTQFSGGKVVGVRLHGDEVEIHIRADRVPLPAVGREVVAAARRVLAAAGDERRVLVVVDDVVLDALDRRGASRE
jgi:hypothetical protein